MSSGSLIITQVEIIQKNFFKRFEQLTTSIFKTIR